MKIVVLAGGWSPERNVSLTSAALIANALVRKGHEVLLLDLYCGIELPADGRCDSLFQTVEYPVPTVSGQVPNLEELKQQMGNPRGYIGPNVLTLCAFADVVYLGLHGAMGEDGHIQATLDMMGVPYTGSGYVGSMMAMDKHLAKEMMNQAGVRVPNGIVVTPSDSLETLTKRVRFPCVVKPSDCGSSVGVFMVDNEENLLPAVRQAFLWCQHVLIEDRIIGREFTMGVLNQQALPPVEIIPKQGFYDYHNKYQAGMTEEICPAQIEPHIRKQMEQASLIAFEALHLKDYARFDFLMDAENELYCLEANTLPGMTPSSLLPQMANANGLSYDDLCETIVQLAHHK